MRNKKVYLNTLDNLNEARQRTAKKLFDVLDSNARPVNFISSADGFGIFGTRLRQKKIRYNQKDADVVIDNSNVNANIVIGPASTAGLSADYGGIGASPHSKGTSNIILQCGLGGRHNNGEGLPDGEITDTNLLGTDSVIYLSTMTDIDTTLSCADGPIGNIKAGSGIGMYTDSIRMRAVCGGVKIITGPDATISTGDSGVNNSMGGKCERASPIMLNAGNMDGDLKLTQLIKIPSLGASDDKIPRLQGVVKGTNMVMCIQELSNILEQLIATTMRLAVFSAAKDSAETAVSMAGVFALPALAIIDTANQAQTWADFAASLNSLRSDKISWEQNYTLDKGGVQGSKYIASVNVFTT
jgi:hypothetical protein